MKLNPIFLKGSSFKIFGDLPVLFDECLLWKYDFSGEPY
jgi:hypothetical protein